MQQIAHQLLELFLKALPTVFVVFLFYLMLRAFFFLPLLKVIKERDARTRGAQKAAGTAQAAAAEKIRQYEDALKQARAQVYAEQDAGRRKLLDERNAQLRAARARAAEEVREAKERIAGELAAARGDVEATSSHLADEITRRILGSRPSAGPATEAR